MRKFGFFLLFFCIWLAACQTDQTYTYDLLPSEVKEFPIDERTNIHTRFVQYFRAEDGRAFLVTESTNKNSLQFFDYHSGVLSKEITFPHGGPNKLGVGLNGAYVKSLDSIYVNASQAGMVARTDTTGVLLEKFNLARLDTMYRINCIASTVFSLQYYQNRLFARISAADWGLEKTGAPIEAEIDLATGQSRICNTHPGTDGQVFGTAMRLPFRTMRNSQLVYSFGFSPYLRILEIDKSSKRKVFMPSRFQKQKAIAVKEPTRENLSRNDFENTMYGPIVYDSYRDVFYRFILHAIPAIDPETGRPNHPVEDRPFSIQVLSADLRLLAEPAFPAKTYVPNIYYVAPEGLYISSSNYSNPEIKEDVYAFTRFELVERTEDE